MYILFDDKKIIKESLVLEDLTQHIDISYRSSHPINFHLINFGFFTEKNEVIIDMVYGNFGERSYIDKLNLYKKIKRKETIKDILCM